MIYITHYEVYDNCVGGLIKKVPCMRKFTTNENLDKFRNKIKYREMVKADGKGDIAIYFLVSNGSSKQMKMFGKLTKKKLSGNL